MVVAHTKDNANENRTNTGTGAFFFQTEPLTLNSCRSLDYARGNESIIYVTDLCKEKAPICKLSRSKAPKRSKLAVTDIRQKPADFFIKTARAST